MISRLYVSDYDGKSDKHIALYWIGIENKIEESTSMSFAWFFILLAVYYIRRHSMAMLQVRDMDDRLYDRLKFAAKRDNRSISQQVVTILQNYFTSVPVKPKNATEEFLKLSGAWEDTRSAEEIIDDIRTSRVNSTRFEAVDGIFDWYRHNNFCTSRGQNCIGKIRGKQKYPYFHFDDYVCRACIRCKTLAEWTDEYAKSESYSRNLPCRRVEYRYYGTICRYKSEHVFQSNENRRLGSIYCSDGNLQWFDFSNK